MKRLTKLALASLIAAALLPTAHVYDPWDHEVDHNMPTFGWEDQDWFEDDLENIMPAF